MVFIFVSETDPVKTEYQSPRQKTFIYTEIPYKGILLCPMHSWDCAVSLSRKIKDDVQIQCFSWTTGKMRACLEAGYLSTDLV